MKAGTRFFMILSLLLSAEFAQAGLLQRVCSTLLLGHSTTLPSTALVELELPAEPIAPPPPPRELRQEDAHVAARNAYLARPDVILKLALKKVEDLNHQHKLPVEIVNLLASEAAMTIDSRIISYLVHNDFLETIIELDGLRYARTDQGLFDYIASYLVSHQVSKLHANDYFLYILTTELGRAVARSRPGSIFDLAKSLAVEPKTTALMFFNWYKSAREQSNHQDMAQALKLLKQAIHSALPNDPKLISYKLYMPKYGYQVEGASSSTYPYFKMFENLYNALNKNEDRILLGRILDTTLLKHWAYMMNAAYEFDYDDNYPISIYSDDRYTERKSFAHVINYFSYTLYNSLSAYISSLEKKVVFDVEDSQSVRNVLFIFRKTNMYIENKKVKPSKVYPGNGSPLPESDIAEREHQAELQNIERAKTIAESKFETYKIKFQQRVLMNPSVVMNPRIAGLLRTCRPAEQAECLFEHFMKMSDGEFESYFVQSRDVTVTSSSRQSTSSSSPTSLNHSGTGLIEGPRRLLQ